MIRLHSCDTIALVSALRRALSGKGDAGSGVIRPIDPAQAIPAGLNAARMR